MCFSSFNAHLARFRPKDQLAGVDTNGNAAYIKTQVQAAQSRPVDLRVLAQSHKLLCPTI